MSTCVFYVDEAGDPFGIQIPLKNGTTPIFTLGSVALPLRTWRERDRKFLASKRHFFPDWLSATSRRDEQFEIKGNDLVAPRNANSERRHAFLRQTLNNIRADGGRCFGVSFIKSPDKTVSSNSIYTQGLQILVERFSLYIAEHEEYDKGIIICDSRMKEFDLQVGISHMSYIFGHSTGRTFTNILEAPLFADSRLTVGLQITDIFTSTLFTNTYNHQRLHDIEGSSNYSHVDQYWSILNDLQYKSVGLVDGYRKFGYRVIDFRDDEEKGSVDPSSLSE